MSSKEPDPREHSLRNEWRIAIFFDKRISSKKDLLNPVMIYFEWLLVIITN